MAFSPSTPVLVIKLGALGDFVQALGPLAAIRHHHEGGRITLLTTEPYGEFAKASGLFDEIWTVGRPATTNIAGWLDLRRRLRLGGFGRVYDLQTSARSSFYRRLFWPGPVPEWSGIAPGCSHPHANPGRDSLHTVERQAEQLSMAGIAEVPAPDLAWTDADVSRFGLPERFALLVPGGATHRPAKRWPPDCFGKLAQYLAEREILPVLLGASEEASIMASIRAVSAEARDLAGQTDLLDLAALGRGATIAVGNDTGPMHLISVVGCPSIVLYSSESDPAICGQRGSAVTIIQRKLLADISVSEVMDAMDF